MDPDVRDFGQCAPVFAALNPHGYDHLRIIQHLLVLQIPLILKKNQSYIRQEQAQEFGIWTFAYGLWSSPMD